MRKIEKDETADAVRSYYKDLVSSGLDEDSLSSPPHRYAHISPDDLFRRVKRLRSFKRFREHLYEEQGGICCYCGRKLESSPSGGSVGRVEHVLPKNRYQAKVGAYHNLLLSCDKIVDEATKSQRHCDGAKNDRELHYTPLMDECETAFVYKVNGTVSGRDGCAEADIKTLNLNAPALIRRRYAAVFESLFEDDKPLPDELLRLYREKVMQRIGKGEYAEFCFVIKQCIDLIVK